MIFKLLSRHDVLSVGLQSAESVNELLFLLFGNANRDVINALPIAVEVSHH